MGNQNVIAADEDKEISKITIDQGEEKKQIHTQFEEVSQHEEQNFNDKIVDDHYDEIAFEKQLNKEKRQKIETPKVLETNISKQIQFFQQPDSKIKIKQQKDYLGTDLTKEIEKDQSKLISIDQNQKIAQERTQNIVVSKAKQQTNSKKQANPQQIKNEGTILKNEESQENEIDIIKIVTFDQVFKSPSIVLSEDLSEASQNNFYYQNKKIVFSEPILWRKDRRSLFEAKFKIVNLKYCVGFGVGLKEVIEKHEFTYKSHENELSHGLYIITSQGYSWSHSQKCEDDYFHYGFNQMNNGDIVLVTLTTNHLLIQFKELRFSLNIPTQILNMYTLCFCAYLHQRNDCVALLKE